MNLWKKAKSVADRLQNILARVHKGTINLSKKGKGDGSYWRQKFKDTEGQQDDLTDWYIWHK